MKDNAGFKILTQAEKDALEHDGRFAGSDDDRRDGFIHLSTAAQLTGTADRHYAGQDGLWIAEVDLEALGDAVRWEPSRGGADFPHLYAPLPLDAVVAYSPLERDADGTVKLPVTG